MGPRKTKNSNKPEDPPQASSSFAAPSKKTKVPHKTIPADQVLSEKSGNYGTWLRNFAFHIAGIRHPGAGGTGAADVKAYLLEKGSEPLFKTKS